jgi:pyruvate,orthophosphate dikinase
MTKWIYYFRQNKAEGNAKMQDLLGGKGANLAEMCNLGLPIPAGFTVKSELCKYYYDNETEIPSEFLSELYDAIRQLEETTGKNFGSTKNPLLLSIRSGAKISMPGMMDTILNLGINDEVAAGMAKENNNPRFVYDSYRRFIAMYGSVVLEISSYLFEETYENFKLENNIIKDSDVTTEILQDIISEYKSIILRYTGEEFETDPKKQLEKSVLAVLKSWMCPRAVLYRNINHIDDIVGTAVNVQSMVFGNKGDSSATGVVFTRSPSDGKNEIFGEFLVNAQGEDVVAGVRTPLPILRKENSDGESMSEQMPEAFAQLLDLCNRLESHYGDMQDIEFTIEEGKLYLLQTRSGKRSAAASVKIAVDMVLEGKISKKEALLSIDAESLNQLLHTAIDYNTAPQIIANGLPASPGAATGIVVFSPYDVEEMSHHHKVILVRNDTSPEDIKGMHLAQGIITARGGMTSHAAVVARGMGKPCVCGVKGLVVDEGKQFFKTSNGVLVKQGDTVTIDGSSGKIITGDVKLVEPDFSKEFETILAWADEIKRLRVRANAETSLDAKTAIKFGADGIGLCRTEHMFFDDNKIPLVREMIIAVDAKQRDQSINALLPLQMEDFKSLFRMLNGLPVNIRLLDPPLHEFLPTDEKDKENLADSLGVTKSAIDHRLHALHEINPMLGHRGCRLGISCPEIYVMQIEAILGAIYELYDEQGVLTKLELMIPLVSDVKELLKIKSYISAKIEEMETRHNIKYDVKLGTMIELPRAAIRSGDIACHVDYFSFGTNDLTQTTYGISRDDIGSFLPDYIEQKIFDYDPFVRIDEIGVGELLSIAIDRGRKSNPKIALGVCGEHAGDPQSINFFDLIGMDYISCSPYRVPIARLAAAQSAIKNGSYL